MFTSQSRRLFITMVPSVLLTGCISQTSKNSQNGSEKCDLPSGTWLGEGEPINEVINVSEDESQNIQCGEQASDVAFQSLNEELDINLEQKQWIETWYNEDSILIVISGTRDSEGAKICPDPEFDYESARALLPSSVTVKIKDADIDEFLHECTREVFLEVGS